MLYGVLGYGDSISEVIVVIRLRLDTQINDYIQNKCIFYLN